jgi:hypothetical protein
MKPQHKYLIIAGFFMIMLATTTILISDGNTGHESISSKSSDIEVTTGKGRNEPSEDPIENTLDLSTIYDENVIFENFETANLTKYENNPMPTETKGDQQDEDEEVMSEETVTCFTDSAEEDQELNFTLRKPKEEDHSKKLIIKSSSPSPSPSQHQNSPNNVFENKHPIQFRRMSKSQEMISEVSVTDDVIGRISSNETKRHLSMDNPLNEKGSKRTEIKTDNEIIVSLSAQQTAALFIEKSNITSNILPPISVDISPKFKKIIMALNESSLKETDFSLVKGGDIATGGKPARSSIKLGQLGNDAVITGFIGQMWATMSAFELANNSSERIQSIIRQLAAVAPKTMNLFPSLAPKMVYEKNVLEDWLVEGLLVAYPSLRNHNSELSKPDAIALILVAALSKPIQEAKNAATMTQMMKQLKAYNGDDSFPIEQFTEISPINQCHLVEKLIHVVNGQNLKYTAEAIKQKIQNEAQ